MRSAYTHKKIVITTRNLARTTRERRGMPTPYRVALRLRRFYIYILFVKFCDKIKFSFYDSRTIQP